MVAGAVEIPPAVINNGGLARGFQLGLENGTTIKDFTAQLINR
jgi:hypothetical protein